MNKTLLSAALIAGFGVAAFAPQAANAAGTAANGTITFTGTLTASTCVVTVNGGASSQTVALPTTALVNGTLSAAGQSAGWTAVTLALSGCTAVTGFTKVTPFFSGTNVDSVNGYLTNTGITGLDVALSTTSDLTKVLDLRAAAGSQGAGTAATITSNPTFNYFAGYVATAAGVAAGSVSTSVQYNLVYN